MSHIEPSTEAPIEWWKRVPDPPVLGMTLEDQVHIVALAATRAVGAARNAAISADAYCRARETARTGGSPKNAQDRAEEAVGWAAEAAAEAALAAEVAAEYARPPNRAPLPVHWSADRKRACEDSADARDARLRAEISGHVDRAAAAAKRAAAVVEGAAQYLGR